MPAVKRLHQESQNNNKAEYIMGHSCQAIALLVGAIESFFAVPLICRIHEGVIFSNRDKRTLFDKMLTMLASLKITELFYIVLDAYYANRKMAKGLMASNNHMISRVKTNAVAYLPASKTAKKPGIGRPKVYVDKIKLNVLFKDVDMFVNAISPVYGEQGVTIKFSCIDLYWRSAGILARYVLVIHPVRGNIVLVTTDTALTPVEVIKLYGLRYKIEFAFKQSLHVVGTFVYHFWMKAMDRITNTTGNQYLHRKSTTYRETVKRKIAAYHRHIQLGLIAHGLLQYLACTVPELIWSKFGSWLRTIRPGLPPSEQVTAIALKNSLLEFLIDSTKYSILKKFIIERIDFSRREGNQMLISSG